MAELTHAGGRAGYRGRGHGWSGIPIEAPDRGASQLMLVPARWSGDGVVLLAS